MKEFKLDNEPKITSGFTTPDGYFDSFSEKMMAQLPKESTKVISIYRNRKRWLFAVAGVLILTLSVPFFNQFNRNSTELDQQTLEDYITYNSGISQNELVDLLEKEDIEKMNVDYNIQDKDLEELLSENNNIEQYITN
jgi:hypothetical protein